MLKPIVTFGEIMLRLAPPGQERFLQSPQFVATFGGGEANVAVALASLGLPAAYVTVLPPANPIADGVIAELRRFGVDTSRIVRAKSVAWSLTLPLICSQGAGASGSRSWTCFLPASVSSNTLPVPPPPSLERIKPSSSSCCKAG